MTFTQFQVRCGRCRIARTFEGSDLDEALLQVRVEGWMSLYSSEYGLWESAVLLAHLCPNCFATDQTALEPSILSVARA